MKTRKNLTVNSLPDPVSKKTVRKFTPHKSRSVELIDSTKPRVSQHSKK